MSDTPCAPDQIAAQAAKAMWQDDVASQTLGMEIIEVNAGAAIVRMPVRQDMINGHKTCHGGFIFTLADSCFAFACNSYREPHVAASCEISFVQPAFLGQILTARARETFRKGRNGIYDVEVSNENGETVALMRGKSRSIAGRRTAG